MAARSEFRDRLGDESAHDGGACCIAMHRHEGVDLADRFRRKLNPARAVLHAPEADAFGTGYGVGVAWGRHVIPRMRGHPPR